MALFADRARQFDPHFSLDDESGPLVARLVRRLDGMPLAIELAAARVEALGVAGLADRLDDRFRLLAGGDRLAAARHRSLAATVEWSYELLAEPERAVFRKLAVLPGPFTLEAAEAVAGADAGPAVLHLVDCSLVNPPRTGPDGRSRYLLLETVRAYGAQRLMEAGEEPQPAAALARFALGVAGEAAAGLQTSPGEVDAGRWLDAEDATVHHVLSWALEHDPPAAVRLATALAPWWFLRGRWVSGYQLLAAAAGDAVAGGEAWCAAQFWLGCLAAPLAATGHREAGLGHLTAVRDALASHPPTPLLARALAWRAGGLANLGRVGDAEQEADRALTLARQLGDTTAEMEALFWLGAATSYAGDHETALACLRQAQRIDPANVPGLFVRGYHFAMADVLIETGEPEAARLECARELELARQAGEDRAQAEALMLMANLDLLAGQVAEARAHLRDALELPGCARRQRAARHSPWPILRPVSWREAAMTEGSEYRAPGVSRAQMRVSTMDRDRAVEVLARAYTEGRLTKDEHDARVGQAMTASTFADLDAVVSDLPSYSPSACRPPAPPVVPRTNALAVASLACGIAQVIVGPLGTIPAIMLGHLARHQIRRTGEGGAGLALVGLLLGWAAVALAGLLIIVSSVAMMGAARHGVPVGPGSP